MKKVSFVIPCYRSANTIGVVVDEIRDTMPTLPEYDYEIILVNDCSPDNTLEVISALALSDRHITAVDLAKNFGQHAALMSGISHSTGDFVVCLDDDGQTPANEVGKLLARLASGQRGDGLAQIAVLRHVAALIEALAHFGRQIV